MEQNISGKIMGKNDTFQQAIKKLISDINKREETIRLDRTKEGYDEKLKTIAEETAVNLGIAKKKWEHAKNHLNSSFEGKVYGAVISYMPRAAERWEEEHPLLCPEEENALFNFLKNTEDYEELDRKYYISFGAAMYIYEKAAEKQKETELVKAVSDVRKDITLIPGGLKDNSSKTDIVLKIAAVVRKRITESVTEKATSASETEICFINTVGSEGIKEAQRKFIEKTDNIFDVFLKIRDKYGAEDKRGTKRLINLGNKYIDYSEKLSGLIGKINCTEETEKLNFKINMIEADILRLMEEKLQNDREFVIFKEDLLRPGGALGKQRKFLAEDSETELNKIYRGSPFEICFAFYSLLISEDNRVFLWAQVAAVLLKTSLCFPWTEASLGIVLPEQVIFSKEIYKKTGMILPYYEELYEENSVKFFSENCRRLSETITGLNNKEVRKERNDLQDEENKKLRKTINLYEHEAKKMNGEIEKLLREKSENEKEILRLREVIYEMKNTEKEENSEEEKKEDFSFPVRPKSKIVVFGGHDSWLREVKKLVCGVRFIRPETKTDINLVKNADKIWIQTNAISHMQYDRVLEITRINNIPLYYFTSASAIRCARQIAESETKQKE